MNDMIDHKTALIFDVDGTLTPSRRTMDPSFREWFLDLQQIYPIYLVTGSDRPKTIEQVGQDVFDRSRIVFNCCGNEAWDGERLIYRNEWSPTLELLDELEERLSRVSFRLRTGEHIESRTGLINFSVIGRGADNIQRAEYVAYDSTRFERRSLVSHLSEKFRDIEFVIAGETGIDIYPKGRDKSQVLPHIPETQTVFFGDAIFLGGNDYGIAINCTQHHRVNGWKHTWEILKSITSK
jgi:phosphomannomutase